MSFAIYTRSNTTWRAIIDCIKAARRSVYIELYAFTDDTEESKVIIDLCCEKAQKGVQVIYILDAFGSAALSRHSITKLQNAGVEIRFFRHWLHRTHKKLTIIDGRTAFLGGVNITQHAKKWHDLHISLSGPILVYLLKSFTKTYILTGGKQKLVERRISKRKYRVKTFVLDHTPISRRKKLKKYYIKKLQSAEKKVSLITPYFFSPLWLEKILQELPKRGVAVEILLPKKTDHPFFDLLNHYFTSRLVHYGVSVYFFPEMNHAKALLIDNTEGLIGSGNIDGFSFKRNSEIGIFFSEKRMLQELSNIIDKWKGQSFRFTPSQKDRLWYIRLFGFLAKTLRPLL